MIGRDRSLYPVCGISGKSVCLGRSDEDCGYFKKRKERICKNKLFRSGMEVYSMCTQTDLFVKFHMAVGRSRRMSEPVFMEKKNKDKGE